MKTRLGANPVALNIPHTTQGRLEGIIDLLDRRLVVFDAATHGKELLVLDVPPELMTSVEEERSRLIERVAECVDWLADIYLSGEPIEAKDVRRAIREATLAGTLIPVFCELRCEISASSRCSTPFATISHPLDRPEAKGMDPKQESRQDGR